MGSRYKKYRQSGLSVIILIPPAALLRKQKTLADWSQVDYCLVADTLQMGSNRSICLEWAQQTMVLSLFRIYVFFPCQTVSSRSSDQTGISRSAHKTLSSLKNSVATQLAIASFQWQISGVWEIPCRYLILIGPCSKTTINKYYRKDALGRRDTQTGLFW